MLSATNVQRNINFFQDTHDILRVYTHVYVHCRVIEETEGLEESMDNLDNLYVDTSLQNLCNYMYYVPVWP